MAAILLFHICPTCSQLPRVCYCFVVSEWASVCARDLLLSSAHTNTQYIRLKNSTSDKGNKSSLMLYLLPYRIIWRGVFFSLIWTLAHSFSLPLSLTLTFSILLGAWALIRLLCCVFATPTHSSSSILLELLVFAWAAVTPNPCIHNIHKKTIVEYILETTSQYILWNIIYERNEKNTTTTMTMEGKKIPVP